MRWLYRLQARLGLSAPEGSAALAILLAFLGGTVALHLRAQSVPLAPDVYAAADATFATADSLAEVARAPAALAALPEALLEDVTSDASQDATAAEIADAAVERAAEPRRSGKPPPAVTNVNTATAADLQRLPRIGPALSQRIVAHRETHGPFQSVEALADVRGIGEKTVERLRPWVRL